MPFILRKTITDTFLARLESSSRDKYKDKPAFLFKTRGADKKWESVTFREFYEQARLLSFGLIELGVKPGDKVAIISHTRIEWQLLDIATMGAKAVTVPISSSITELDMAALLEHSESQYIIVENAVVLEKLMSHREKRPNSLPLVKKIIVIDSTAITSNPRKMAISQEILTLSALKELGKRSEGKQPALFQENLVSALPEDIFSLCYTTGTSGEPKCVPLSHQNLMSVIEDCTERMNRRIRSEREVMLAILPFSHVMGRLQSLIYYTMGGTLAFSRHPDEVLEDLRHIQPTLIFSVPRIFEKSFNQIQTTVEAQSRGRQKLFRWALSIGRKYQKHFLEKKTPPLSLITQYAVAKRLVFHPVAEKFGGKLRYAICGGARLNRELGEFFEIAGIRILEGYGLTETCSAITLNDPDRPRYGSVGRPLSEVSLKIAEDGEILVKSKKVFSGYLKDRRENSRVLNKGWFHTGDTGQLDADGYLYITDRKRDIIVTNSGKSIAPQKIEILAKTQKIIRELVAYGDNQPYISALITLDRELVTEFANQNQILFSDYEGLIKNPKILLWVERALDEINQQLSDYERIKKFIILPQDFSVESGELGSSQKIKRRVIYERYQNDLEQLYSSPH